MPTPSTHAFSEKVALITDGADPVGRAIALQLALYGTYVIVGFPTDDLENTGTLHELRSLGTLAGAVQTDIRTIDGARQLVGEVEKMFGRLDLLVNTLKYRSDSAFLETQEDLWTRTVDANLKSAFFVTREAIRLMSDRPKPAIVNLAYAGEGNVAFSAVQAALVGLTKSLAREFGPKFRINCVRISDKMKGEKKPEILDPELFRPKKGISEDDIARAVVYLLSSEAVGLNGQILTVG
jgi:3-oxoacyl-[acyl-carrier protein] reductase